MTVMTDCQSAMLTCSVVDSFGGLLYIVPGVLGHSKIDLLSSLYADQKR